MTRDERQAARRIRGEGVVAEAERILSMYGQEFVNPISTLPWPTCFSVDDEYYYLSPHQLVLADTAEFVAMTEAERRWYSLHELCGVVATVLWLERLLITRLGAHIDDLQVPAAVKQALLLEIADEARHSAAFQRVLAVAGLPDYSPKMASLLTPGIDRAERRMVDDGKIVDFFFFVLAAEELFDVQLRASRSDTRVHPVVRAVADLHVKEEARHIGLARLLIEDGWLDYDEAERAAFRDSLTKNIGLFVKLMVNREVYRSIWSSDAPVTPSRAHQALTARALSRLQRFLVDAGVLEGSDDPFARWSLLVHE